MIATLLQQNRFIKLILSLGLFAVSYSIGYAEEYEHGNHALQLFDAQGMENSPAWVKVWIALMMLTFLAGLFFVWNHAIARWVVGGMFAGMGFGMLAGSVFGVPALSGFIALVHVIFWSPGLYLLLTKRPFLGPRSAFSIWSGVMTFVILFSFIFDIRDTAIYLAYIL